MDTPRHTKPPFIAGLPDGPLERPSDFPDYDGPLVCPFYGPDHPARRDEESKEPFNEDVARMAFGSTDFFYAAAWQQHWHFHGDWWMLLFLRWCAAEAHTLDPAGINPTRFKMWSETGFVWQLQGVKVHLEGANLLQAPLHYITLSGSYLCGSSLAHAYLSHAWLRSCSLERCQLDHAWLDNTEMRGAVGALFDRNPADRMRIDGNAPDPWSVLRRTYTGPRYFVHLVLTLAFLLPFALKAFHLTALGEAYEAVAAVAVQRGHEGLDTAIPRAGLRDVLDRFDQHHAPAPAWWVLIGGLDAWYFALMTMVVAAYNLLRIVLTLGVPQWLVSGAPRTSVGGVTALREAEERSRVTPALEDYYGPLHPLSDEYKRRVLGWTGQDGKLQPPERERGRVERVAREWAWLAVERLKYNPRFPMMTIGLYRMHLFARLLFWLAAGAFVFHLMHWVLTATVPVPIDAML